MRLRSSDERHQYDGAGEDMTQSTYSEKTMGDAFEQRLRSRRPLLGVGRFTQVFREVDCHRGRPDFIGVTSRSTSQSLAHRNRHNLAAACLLSLLKSRAPRALAWLTKQSGLSRDVVVRSLRELVQSGLVDELSRDRFLLSGGSSIFEIETTAFELKLKSPRRAVFQAQQYTLFAQRVWIVVPPRRVPSFDFYCPVLDRWGIGVASFDPYTHRFRVVHGVRRRPAVSREHQAYAMLRLIGGPAT